MQGHRRDQPLDPRAPLIRYQVNLPSEWNGSSIQFGGGGFYGSGALQYFFVRQPTFDLRRFDPEVHAERLRQISSLMDGTNPDLSAFAGRGGKLIVGEHMADHAQSPYAGIEYYRAVVARMVQLAVDAFMRLYVTLGADHMGLGAPSSVDLLTVLTEWVEKGKTPGDLVQVKQQPEPPFAVTMSRPMCRYPAYPRYRGSGHPRVATSFLCVSSSR